MKKITTRFCAGVLFFVSIASANAALVTPDNYVYLTDPSNAQVPYLDPANTDLTDGVISPWGWGNGITYSEAYKYVGWELTDPMITFNFGSTVSIGSLTLWVDDANGNFGVKIPTQVSITMGGATVVRSIANPPGAVPVGVLFDRLNLTGDSLTLHVSRGGHWTMISEVQFASPVPLPAALWLFGSGLVAVAGVSLRRQRFTPRHRAG